MLKSVDFLSKTIFNYLGEENCAALSALTDIYLGEHIPDGVLWVQYSEKNADNARESTACTVGGESNSTFLITAVAAVGNGGRTVVFPLQNSDFEELDFITGDVILSPCKRLLKLIDKNYLMRAPGDFRPNEKGVPTDFYGKIAELSGLSKELTEQKIYRNKKNCCQGTALSENGTVTGGGFITRGGKYSVITDVFVKPEYRNKGLGTAIVKNLLKLSCSENVYLVCKGDRIQFYESMGFSAVKEIYEYKR